MKPRVYPKLSRSPRNATSCLALRWGRARVRAEMRLVAGPCLDIQRLQWGRARVRAEMGCPNRQFRLARAASMGPR
ncbi:MAG: hypothetical protein NZ898_11305, partial [Myxococcota bacterium]|nr:hypothetical protein [Myxococcota bacterium]